MPEFSLELKADPLLPKEKWLGSWFLLWRLGPRVFYWCWC
jgi:hypothetical protein